MKKATFLVIAWIVIAIAVLAAVQVLIPTPFGD